jgi:hypothetical protein
LGAIALGGPDGQSGKIIGSAAAAKAVRLIDIKCIKTRQAIERTLDGIGWFLVEISRWDDSVMQRRSSAEVAVDR